MSVRAPPVAALLFGSGLCALVYQVAWLRELRLVFGASTPASAAVLAVFMGGLGAGSLWLGKRADVVARPLRMYSNLEAGIAASAALSPALLYLVRWLYVALGGSLVLGSVGSAVARLLLSALVLLPPTLLMGGTLPAAARAVTDPHDGSRRGTALLYGANTTGAVIGATVTTFVMLEVFGTRLSLWMGCAVNALVAVLARVLDRSLADDGRAAASATAAAESPKAPGRPAAPARPPVLILVAACGVGFAFLLMELVWYRVLNPLLGGTSYTFGLILAVALLGIGAGGLSYTLRPNRPAHLRTFAMTCGLEAAFIALPYALGDRVALLAIALRPLTALGLSGQLVGWTLTTALVVLPAAVVAGYQFPLLIALLGRGDRSLGRHVGLAYAANTLGAIVGSIAGGFLFFPILGALGSWRAGVLTLVALGVAALVSGYRRGTRWQQALLPALIIVVAPALLFGARGPTAVWRHSPIGAGRVDHWLRDATANSLEAHMRETRRAIAWEADGRESTIGLHTLNDTAFLVNGKSDGAAVLDAGTQIMSGLLGAILQRQPVRRALVIGLGTGSTAGWLGALPGIERVDVVELEPAILHVAAACTAVNHGVLHNPKVHIIIGDAREVLLTSPGRYDLIASEPSNPYRAGVASLFTNEFYRAVRQRLLPGGVFIQWMQAYEIHPLAIRTVYTTLSSVFPSVTSWRSKYGDLMLLSREADQPVDVALLRARIAQSPYREALFDAWRARTAEEVLARFVARPSLARAIAEAMGPLHVNTDDRNLLEFVIARSLGKPRGFSIEDLQLVAKRLGGARPALSGEGANAIDWERVTDALFAMGIVEMEMPRLPKHQRVGEAQIHRFEAHRAWRRGKPVEALRSWQRQRLAPKSPVELMIVADGAAVAGKEMLALALIDRLAALEPVEAAAIEAKLHWAMGRPYSAFDALRRAVEGARRDPWPNNRLMIASLTLLYDIAQLERPLARQASALLAQELAVHNQRYLRIDLRLDVALLTNDASECRSAIGEYGPDFPWDLRSLEHRYRCYVLADDQRAEAAASELAVFIDNAGSDISHGIGPQGQPPATATP